MVQRDCSYDPLNCERIQLRMRTTADMVGQTAHLSRAAALRAAAGAPSRICGRGEMDVKLIGTIYDDSE